MAETQRTKYGTARDALLRAAVTVVARHGLHGMTFRKVADEAGVHNSLVAHHFGSLSNLAAAALEWAVTVASTDSHLPNFLESESEYKEALWSTLDRELEVHAYQFEMILEAGRDEALRSQIVELYARYTADVARSMFGPEPTHAQRAVARAVFASLDGLVLQYVGGAIDREQLDDSVSALWQLASSTRTTAPS